MKLYKTAARAASAEYEVERSRFIAHVRPVESREEAEAFYTEIRKKYRDATHNVPALVLGDKFQVQWASDDGEPQGTSGAPMVQLMVNEGITDTAVIVTRYFGGIKLGTGGLVRAYTAALKEGLAASGLCEVKSMCELKARFDYSSLARLQNMAAKGTFAIEDILYEDVITVTAVTEPDRAAEVKGIFSDISQGKYVLVSEEVCEKRVEI